MVHNKEKYASINYIEYNIMTQEQELMDRYYDEYRLYQTRMDDYKRLNDERNAIIEQNNECSYWDKEQDPYARYYAYKGSNKKIPEYKIKVPPVPTKPEYMEPIGEVNLYDYYDEEKFDKAWMLNISPDWKGVVITREMIEFFRGVIEEFYDNCDRFTKMKYVLENGHGKDHLHAHIVFTLNTKKPGYMTSIKKGNILNEWRNCWNRLANDNASIDNMTVDDEWVDAIDLCKHRSALNTCLLTTKGMYRDKIDYLDEEKKPTSHKNDEHPLCPVKGSKGYD
jgi:hypothetical protein